MFHLARRACFVCRGAVRGMVASIVKGCEVDGQRVNECCVGTVVVCDRCCIVGRRWDGIHVTGVILGCE